MAQSKNPAAVATADGAKVNASVDASQHNTPAPRQAQITTIRRGPGGKADWLVTIEGVCTDAPMRDRKLRSYRRFSNAMQHRFGVTFAPMQQAEWAAMIAAAIAKGGAA